MPSDPHPLSDGATFRAIFQHSLDAILLTAPDGQIMLANPAACRMLSRTEAEIQRLGRVGLMDPTDERLAAALEERARTGRFSGELRMLHPDGTSFPVDVTSALFTDDHGETRTCTVIRDLSEREAADRVRAKAERLSALRELAVGVRHEVNNTLAALRAELQLLGNSAHLVPVDRHGVNAALAGADRIAEALRRLSNVEQLESVTYIGTTRMLDLSPEPPDDDAATGIVGSHASS